MFIKNFSKVAFFTLSVFFYELSFSKDILSPAENSNHLMAQKAYFRLFDEVGYSDVVLTGFVEQVSGSMTGVFRSGDDFDNYIAEIMRLPEGARLIFRVYKSCHVTSN